MTVSYEKYLLVKGWCDLDFTFFYINSDPNEPNVIGIDWIITMYVIGTILMTTLAYKGEERGLKLIAWGLFWPFIILYSLFAVND